MLTALLLAVVCADNPGSFVLNWQNGLIAVRKAEIGKAQKAVDEAKPDTPARRKAEAALKKTRDKDVLEFSSGVTLPPSPPLGAIGFVESINVSHALTPTEAVVYVRRMKQDNKYEKPYVESEEFIMETTSTKKWTNRQLIQINATYEVVKSDGNVRLKTLKPFDAKKWKPEIPAE